MEAEDRCEAILQKGVANDQVPGVYPATLKSTLNCTFQVDGKIAYVALPEDTEKAAAFINELPILNELEFFDSSTPDGVYTWILYKKGDKAFHWAFRPVRSILEVGTIHKSIARAVRASTIHAAGEIERKKDEFIINFLSGSFMLKDCDRVAKEKVMQSLFKTMINSPFIFTDKTLITAQPTMEELQFYASKGFRVCLHDPDKVAECKAAKGVCENMLKGGRKRKTRRSKRRRATRRKW